MVDPDNPWPGLAAFREADQEFFHGRELATGALHELVTRERVAVLYGASGLGKTSLLRAGLFPRVRADDLFPVYIRLAFGDPPEDLTGQVWGTMLRAAEARRVEAPPRAESGTLWEFLYRNDALWWNERHRIVTPLLVFDQFEEIFTLGRLNRKRTESSQRLLDDLASLILGRPPRAVTARCEEKPEEALRYSVARTPLKVLFSFREDFLPEFTALRERLPGGIQHQFRLLRMSPEDAKRVVLGAGRHLVDEAVAGQIVAFVAAAGTGATGESGSLTVEPALLSVFCRELNYERRKLGHAQITGELVEQQQEAILANFYERSLEGIDSRVRVFIEDHLLLPKSGVRTSIAEEVALVKPGVTRQAIDHLIGRRLLRREERGGPAHLELTHDVLAEPVRQSRALRRRREKEEKRLRRLRQAEEQARRELEEARERGQRELQLKTAQTEAERARADLAERQAEFERGRQRGLRLVVGVVLVLLTAAVMAAVSAWRSERRSQLLASAVMVQEAERRQMEGRSDLALMSLGRAARLHRQNDIARSRLIDLLLYRTRALPVAVFPQAQAVWAQFTEDGAHILSATRGQPGVSLWRVDSSSQQPEDVVLDSPPLVAQFDHCGRHVLTVSSVTDVGGVRDLRAELWDTRDFLGGERRPVFSTSVPDVVSAAFSPETMVVATSHRDDTIRLWSVSVPDDSARVIAATGGPFGKLQFSPDGSRLFTASMEGAARLWDVATGRELARLEGHVDRITSMQFAPDGNRLLTGSEDLTALVWELPQTASAHGAVLIRASVLLKHDGAVWTVRFSSDGRRIVTASEDRTARLWDAAEGGPVGQPMQHGGAVWTAFFSADAGRVVTASQDGSARVWASESGDPVTEPIWHDAPVRSALWSPEGEQVVTASDDGTVGVWDVRPGAALPTSLTVGGSVSAARFDPAEGRTALVGSDNGAVLWDLEREQQTHAFPTESSVTGLEFSPDGRSALTVSGRDVQIWDTGSGKSIGAPMRHDESVTTARFAPDGIRIVTVSSDGTARLWDTGTTPPRGEPLPRVSDRDDVECSSFPVQWAEFSSDGRWIATAAGEPAVARGLAAVWDVTRTPATCMKAFPSEVPRSVARLSTDRKWLLVAGGDDTATLWPLGPEERRGPIRLAAAGTALAEFNRDGDRAVTVSSLGVATIWHLDRTPPAPRTLSHQPVGLARFSRDGLRLVTMSWDGTMQLWDARSGDAATLPLAHVHRGIVYDVEFSPDGERLVTASDDGRARVWHVPRGTARGVPNMARLAEVLSGYTIRVEPWWTRIVEIFRGGSTGDYRGEHRLEDPVGALRKAREAFDVQKRHSAILSERVASWVLADRWTRTISPFASMTVDQFVRERLEAGDEARSEAARAFPGHPAFHDSPARPDDPETNGRVVPARVHSAAGQGRSGEQR